MKDSKPKKQNGLTIILLSTLILGYFLHNITHIPVINAYPLTQTIILVALLVIATTKIDTKTIWIVAIIVDVSIVLSFWIFDFWKKLIYYI